MQATWCVSVLAVALVATAGCGKSEKQKQAEAAAEQAKQAAAQMEDASKKAEASANQMAKGLEAMAQGLAGAAASAAGDGKLVDPVSFKELQALFPDIPGWEKGKPRGERMTAPVGFSQAEVRYTKGDASIELKIVDSGFQQLLLAPYTMFLTAGYEKETESGYEKSTKVNNEPGWEKWNSEAKHGEVNAVVGKRFLVQAEGDNLEGIASLQDAVRKTDFVKLAALK
jgi:hypothetical protein